MLAVLARNGDAVKAALQAEHLEGARGLVAPVVDDGDRVRPGGGLEGALVQRVRAARANHPAPCDTARLNPRRNASLARRDRNHNCGRASDHSGSVIIGGLIGLALGQLNANWQVKLLVVLVPAAVYGIGCLSMKFPPTERVASGITAGQMFRELFRPFFLVWFLSMFLTAAAELAPGQWVDIALTRTVGMKGIWLLIYVSGLMFVMRHFAGPLATRLSPVGLLWVSCFLASAGLLLLSVANSPVTGLLAATVWGTGVCYMWPTMLAAANERFPRGGALLMGLMGTAGTASIYFVLPMMGRVFDDAKIAAAGGEEAFKALQGDQLANVLSFAAQTSFRYVAALPAILLIVFGIIWIYDRARGGYKPERI
jgi:hypothetical protein